MSGGQPYIPEHVETEVSLQEVLSADTGVVLLPNGKPVFGYRSERGVVPGDGPVALVPGGRWMARLFLADFSRAELVRCLDSK
jgi:hypothetical protein